MVPFAEVKRFGKTSPPYLTKNSSAAAFSADVMRAPWARDVEATAAQLWPCRRWLFAFQFSDKNLLLRAVRGTRIAVQELPKPLRYVPGRWDECHFKKLSSR